MKAVSKTLDDVLNGGRRNNFNMIRLIMALGVLYKHSFRLFVRNGRDDVVSYIFKFYDSGSFSVAVFFLVSGILLSQSFHNTSGGPKFILKRLLRIFPGLFVCIAFTVVIVGAINTSLPLSEYFTSRGTYRYFYNVFLNNEYFFYSIPGVFTNNRTPDIVNGSLWTLPYELICYVFLFLILSGFYYLKSETRSIAKKFFIAGVVLFFAIYLLNAHYIVTRIWGLMTGFKAPDGTGNNPLFLFMFFGIGMAFYFLRRIIRLNIFVFLFLCVLLAACHYFQANALMHAMEVLVIAYGIILWAGAEALYPYNFKVDPSYGIYLYAWPVQQTISHYFVLGPYQSMLLTIPVTVLLGYLSYVFVEKPAINYASPFYAQHLAEKVRLVS